jgi:hypothetical protein
MAETKYTPNQLKNWFTEKIKQTAGYQDMMRKFVFQDHQRKRNSNEIGKMYIYEYDAKLKDKLDIWDRFPLVFPIESYPDGFLGLNIHYLPMKQRKAFLAMLEEYTTNQKLTPNTKLKMTYDLMQRSKKLKTLGNPCVHRYLHQHIRSQFIEIPSSEWQLAAELPIELWVKKKV